MEHDGDGDASCDWCAWSNPQKIGKGTGRLGNKKTGWNYPDNNIIKISQNTDKSPKDLRRIDVNKPPVKTIS